ncbi:MAG: DUF4255 domain-containing protein [Cyanobacteria bacterium P01_F01_bin.56]
MSNHLAIATVTATLQRTLQTAIQKDFEGARITTLSPNEVGKGTPETGVNVFMYQVITNPALHNVDIAPMRTKGNPVKRQAALDLYYMLSCYGNNNELAPQRLMGSVVQTMNDRRVITQDMIREACQDATLAFLQDSTLAYQVQKINVLPLDLNLEDLSKTWSVFFQTPYMLSVAYKALVVLVDGREAAARGLPVRSRNGGGVLAFAAQPHIEQVVAQSGLLDPIFVDSDVLIKGQYLKGYPYTQVRIRDREVSPQAVTANQLKLSLARIPRQSLRAGGQILQVIHPLMAASSSQRPKRRGPESNGVPLVLRPRILQSSAVQLEVVDNDLCNAEVTIQVDVPVDPEQKVVLSLSEWWPVDDERWQHLQEKTIKPPVAQLFEASKREAITPSLHFVVSDIKPETYLVRVLIDGAESPLDVDVNEWLDPATQHQPNPQFNWYVSPRISLVNSES